MYLTQGLHRSVQQTPDAAMTIFGDRQRTFREVIDRVARLAGALRQRGVGDGDRVAMLAQNSDRYCEYFLAVPWADAALNPVNTRWSTDEIVYSFKDSETNVLFIDEAFLPMLPALHEQHPSLHTVIYCGDGAAPNGTLGYEALIADATPIEDARRGGTELAGVFYTGGTTGFPKGVMLSHDNLLTSALGTIASGIWLEPGATLMHVAPLFHLADLAAVIAQFILGGPHVFVPSFEPVAVLKAISKHRVNATVLVPTMIQLLVDHPAVAEHDLGSLHTVLYGASPIPQALLERAMKTIPSAAFAQAYGMTELSPVATLLGPDQHTAGGRLRSAGRAAPHSELAIMDENDNVLPVGQVGEVVVRGGHVMLGYWNRPEDTARAIRDGWMHTGDGGYLDDDGYLFITDRIKDMIVTGGENVYSAEVEHALASHPAIASCAVIGVPDQDWGERVHAVVVLAPGCEVTAAELREYAKTHIAGYKAPRTVEFVAALPVSGAGKVLKRELRRKYWTDGARQVN